MTTKTKTTKADQDPYAKKLRALLKDWSVKELRELLSAIQAFKQGKGPIMKSLKTK